MQSSSTRTSAMQGKIAERQVNGTAIGSTQHQHALARLPAGLSGQWQVRLHGNPAGCGPAKHRKRAESQGHQPGGPRCIRNTCGRRTRTRKVWRKGHGIPGTNVDLRVHHCLERFILAADIKGGIKTQRVDGACQQAALKAECLRRQPAEIDDLTCSNPRQ
jgi:hypothetical protein